MVSLTIFCLLSCVVSGAVTQSISSLSTSLKALEASLDQNNDGQVTKAERDFDLQNNFDTNRDGCVDALEWSTRLTSLNFTKELASYILTLARSTNISRPAGCDGISVYYGQPGTTEGLVSSYIYTLTRMCEGDTTLYLTNSDCRQLPRACNLYCNNTACYDYSINIARKRFDADNSIPVLSQVYQDYSFEFAFDRLIRTNDLNGDGVITAAEFAFDSQFYEIDSDTCLTKLEFTARWMFVRCGGLGLSQEFAEQRFDDLMVMFGGTNPACDGIDEAAFGSDFPTPAFIDSQLQTLITMCEADRSRYQSVKDCNKLLDFCVYSAKYSGSQGCKNYINGVIKGIYGFAF